MIELQKNNAHIAFTTPSVIGGSGGYVDLSNYYTKEEVDQAIAAIDIPEVDLSNYYTIEDIDGKYDAQSEAIASNSAKISKIEDAGYQTAEQVNAAINEALGVIENGTY